LDSVDSSIDYYMKEIGRITNNIYVQISHKEINSNNSPIDDALKFLSNLKELGIEDGIHVINKHNNLKSKFNISQFFIDNNTFSH